MNHPSPAQAADLLEHALDELADVEATIARGEVARPQPRRVRHTAIWLAVTGISLYLVAPALIDTLASADELADVSPAWFGAMAALQAASLVCMWWLQRIAVHTHEWFAVATSQLAGNGMAKIAPGGGAIGAALQYRMLVQAGVERGHAVSGLTATNLLTLGIVLVLPLLALPTLVGGTADRNLERAAIAGFIVFGVLFAAGAWVLSSEVPLRRIGRLVQDMRNRLRPHAAPVEHLPERLVRERNRIVRTVGRRWRAALAAGVARWALDYASLYAALAAAGSAPNPALVLLAFCAAQLLAQIPITPGGLGFVEAGLTAMLGLAGVPAAHAVLATLAYRLFTYWLPLPLGLLGAVLHRRRYATDGDTLGGA